MTYSGKTAMDDIRTIFAGVVAAPDTKEWENALKIFQENAKKSEFATAFVTRFPLGSTKKFIDKIVSTTRKSDKERKNELDNALIEFLSQHQIFNRFARAGNEETILPWIKSIRSSAQKLSIILNTDLIPSILRKPKVDAHIEGIENIFDRLNKGDLKQALSNEKIEFAVRGRISQEKINKWKQRAGLEPI